jgi:uncharacterized protein (TIGR03437 family)
MCPDTTRRLARSAGRTGLALFSAAALFAQAFPPGTAAFRPDWRRIGNSAVEASLASLATGPVDRVWYSADGARLLVRTSSGRVFATSDFEKWTPDTAAPPRVEDQIAPARLPEAEVRVRARSGRLYAVGRNAYRSEDGGRSWANLTAYGQESVLGGELWDLAVSPNDPEELVVAGSFGVWRSLDGGLTWHGLNDALPNLPVRRILGLPRGTQGMRIFLEGIGSGGMEVEWRPGERHGWTPAANPEMARELAAREVLSRALNANVTALAVAGTYLYAGSADGRLWTSADLGRTWLPPREPQAAPIERIWVDPRDPRFALAAAGRSPAEGARAHVLRTANGGLFWDDLTANLGDHPVFAVTADRASGAIYAATARGLMVTFADLHRLGPSTPWVSLEAGLPEAAAVDVRLDEGGNQIFAAIAGYGVYAAPAPHRFRDLRVVNAADYSARPAAPGSLLSVLGGRVRTVRAGDLDLPVLDASASESQIQVPFEARGTSLSLALEANAERFTLGVPLQSASPAVFVDPDGTAFVLDADTGLRLDAATPARSNGRIQILATGLGKVDPEWPTGLPAPLENTPQVAAPVRVYLDRLPIPAERATLAPGYVGYYLIEARLPEIVNSGPAELFIEVDGQESNRVRIYLEP